MYRRRCDGCKVADLRQTIAGFAGKTLKYQYNSPLLCAGLAELVDAADLKFAGLWSCGFDSRTPHHFYISG